MPKLASLLRCLLQIGLLGAILIGSQISSAHGNLMGVDLGLSYLKVSVARPGRGLELVTNEQAKRKTPAAVGFTEDGERLFGDAAIAYAGKAPSRVVLDGRSLAGDCSSDPNPDTIACNRSVVTVPGAGVFNGEEVAAMLLSVARSQASAALDGASIKDVVISVPAWFDERHRAAIADAAKIVGLNCLTIVNSNTAAAIKYAVDGKASHRDSEDEEENKQNGSPSEKSASSSKSSPKKNSIKARAQTVMFFDLGAGSATATVAQIITDPKSGVTTAVKVLGHAWELDVGGRALDNIIVEKLASDFDKQRGPDAIPSREIPRVMMRLRKEAQRIREILSANTETQVGIASLHEDTDLRTVATRDYFESAAEDILIRAVRPAMAVLKRTGISANKLDAVVPFGGASRTPKFQRLLCTALGRSSLNKSINSDEAAVMGAAFVAASLSSTFRVRKLDIEDAFARGVSAEVDKSTKSGGRLFSSSKSKADIQKVVIFPAGSGKMPSKKTLHFKRSDDFSVSVYLDDDPTKSSRLAGRTLHSKFRVTGVAKVFDKLNDKEKAKSLTPQIALTILIDRSGFIRVGTAESSIDETIIVEREVEVENEDESEKNGSDKSSTVQSNDVDDLPTTDETEKSDTDGNETVEKDPMDLGSAGVEDKSYRTKKGGKESKSKESKLKKKTRKEESTQTIVHRQALTVTYEDDPLSLVSIRMTRTEVEKSKNKLQQLEKVDRERLERSEALNLLEGFVLEARSQMNSVAEEDPLFEVTTKEQRENFVKDLEDAEDWMYSEDATRISDIRKRLHELRRTHSAMENKAAELQKRPMAVARLRDRLEMAAKDLAPVRELHVERGSALISSFDKHDLLVQDINSWLRGKEDAQKELSPVAEAAFTSSDVEKKEEELRRSVLSLLRLELPPERKVDKDSTGDNVTTQTNSTSEGLANGKGENGSKLEDNEMKPGAEAESGHPEEAKVDLDVDVKSGSASDPHDEL